MSAPDADHPRQRAEADVEHRPVAADHPQLALRIAGLVPARPDAERDRRRVLEQRVRPRHEERIERVGAAVDRVAAGGRDDPHRLRAVDLASGRDHLADRGRLAATGARPGPAEVADGVLAEQEVGQGLLVAIDLGRRRQGAEEAHVARERSSVLSPVGSSATLSIITSASWPSAAQTSTHSAQPLQWTGSTKMPNAPARGPCVAGTSPYFVVGAKWDSADVVATVGVGLGGGERGDHGGDRRAPARPGRGSRCPGRRRRRPCSRRTCRAGTRGCAGRAG